MAFITYKGIQYSTNGELPKNGSVAPKFKLTHGDLSNARLSDYAGKKVILNIFHTMDTPLCPESAHKFNNIFEYRKDVVILVISNDLPFAHRHLCSVDDIKNVIPLSMMKDRNFAKDYGILIESGPLTGLLARSIVVINEDGKVTYTQLVPEVLNEPDYSEAVDALKN